MLYHLFDWLEKTNETFGASLFQYVTFRAGLAVVLSLIISVLFGNKLINLLRNKQVGETVRDLGLDGQKQKQGTPTMGGLIIILAIMLPCILMARLDNIYIQLMLACTIWMGTIGFIDDYIKVFKKDKEGLKGKFKVLGQVIFGLIIGVVMFFSNDVVVRMSPEQAIEGQYEIIKNVEVVVPNNIDKTKNMVYVKAPVTTVPFIKDNENGIDLDYANFTNFLGDNGNQLAWIFFIPFVIFIVTAVSNAANLTDGIDGLAAGVSAIIGVTLAILAYVSGHSLFADYLGILFIPDSSELVVFAACFVGACMGFLWFNAYPAKVFMGDTGSLTLGGIIAALAILIRKELLIPVLCGIFVIENLSVMLQVSYFKYTRKKYGEGRRIFKMSPLHHHYQKKGMHESKIVSRFLLVGILLAVLTLVTLKLR